MQEIPELFDPEKPYARFYSGADNTIDGTPIICQVHTRKIEGLGFGRIGWRISVSISGPDGATLSDESGLQILQGAEGTPYRHEITIQADSVEDPAALLDTERKALAQKAANAATVWRSAQDVF